ncbi:MAG: hypothetical protein OHK0050_43410 [Roseiflexaceae bacterium]
MDVMLLPSGLLDCAILSLLMEPYPTLLTFSWPFPIVSIFGKILLEAAIPTHRIDPHSILQPYLEQAGVSEEVGISEQWLIDSGLHAAVVGRRLDHEVLV